jgi:hypothetical protein
MADYSSPQRLQTYCAPRIARCGAVAMVENGRFTRLKPDPGHRAWLVRVAEGIAILLTSIVAAAKPSRQRIAGFTLETLPEIHTACRCKNAASRQT